MTGNGNFRYTQSLDLSSANTYELNLDAFYSSSTNSNLGIYLVSGSTSSSIATLSGTQPTKNLLDTTIPFKVDRDYPTASLYFSQSQGQWHLGNVSLKLSEDTAFSPDEISFITTMPTVLGNETFNFKFEFYDVNNNYVPVAVTQSALFNGGNTNIGGTILLISSSASSSLADLNRVSSSISGTVTFTSSSVSGSIYSLSGSVSGTIGTLSGSVSQSVALTLSSSLSKVQQLADGTFGYSGTFIDGTTVFAPVIGGTTGYISGKFTVGAAPNSIVLDAQTSTRKIYIGTGTYNDINTNVYLDSTGKFSLGTKLTWNGSDTLTIAGALNGATGTFSGALSGGTISIGSGDSIFKADSNGIYLGNATFASAPFRVTPGGSFVGQSGTIGGWTMSASSLTGGAAVLNSAGSISIGSGNTIFKADSNGIYLGNATFASAPFRVTQDGALTATSATITGTITVTGGNAETTSGAQSKADAARDSAVSTASGDATTKSNNAYNNAVAAAAGDATTKSNTAYNNAISAASTDATTKSNAAFASAAAQVKSLADGGYAGAFISSTTIYAPTIGGTTGYISNQFRVGDGGIVLDGVNKRIYIGSGTYGNSNTGFYADSSGNFSLGNKLTFNGSVLSINGSITATGGTFTGDVTAGGVTIGTSGINVTGTYGITVNSALGLYIQGAGTIKGYDGSYREFENNRVESDTSQTFAWYARNQNAGEGAVAGRALSSGNWSFYGNGKVGGASYPGTSDRRVKSEIKNLDSNFGINFIKKLNPVEYKFNDDLEHKRFGFIAQEVTSSISEYGMNISNSSLVDGNPDNSEAILHLNYMELIAPLVKSVQQLSAKVEQLEARLSGSV